MCIRDSPWFWSKNSHFSTFFFLGNIGQEKVFYDILERKNAFLGYRNKNFKKLKNEKTFIFSVKVIQENVFYDIVERKNAFLSYKNKKF